MWRVVPVRSFKPSPLLELSLISCSDGLGETIEGWSARVNSHWHTRVTSKIRARVHAIHYSWGGRGLSGEFVHKRAPLTRLLLVLNASFSSSATWRQSPKGRWDSAGLLLLLLPLLLRPDTAAVCCLLEENQPQRSLLTTVSHKRNQIPKRLYFFSRHRRLLLASGYCKFSALQTMRTTEWELRTRGRTLCFHRGCPVRRRKEQTWNEERRQFEQWGAASCWLGLRRPWSGVCVERSLVVGGDGKDMWVKTLLNL